MFRNWTNETWAFMVLRLWLALRWLFAGLEKFELHGSFSIANHAENMERMARGIASSAPLLPEWMTKIYAWPLGYLQILLGLVLLLGIKTKLCLIASALFFVSLSVGMMAVSEEQGIAWLGIHLVLNAAALILVTHNRLTLFKD